jgi:hypothetical protein
MAEDAPSHKWSYKAADSHLNKKSCVPEANL